MASKQKQRTKGNTRPSSSGRAAELLAREGAGATAGASGFIGFGTMSGDLGYVPAAQSLSLESDQDSSLETDFRMALRKLTKRDVVTKLKAIQEFGALCKEKNAEAVKGTLPHWPRMYSRLATDHDKRVREATQQAFEQLILRVRRSLAPQLRALMGPWLLAQCDTYAPAALSARAAFQSAFPAAKQGEAVAFCKTEILRYLEDNLFKETAASLSDPKSYTPEEQEEKYLRIQTCSVLGLGEFVTVLPEKELSSIQDTLAAILAENKLWKLAKSKSPQLRNAMYSLQGSLMRSAPSIAEAQLARISTTLLGGLDESDPLAVQALWESVLLVVSAFPNCWEHVNVRKAVLPKLWAMLRAGGNGSATVIHPNLLPLLSHVPSDVTGSGVMFYREFFGNIKEGLTCSSARQSASEYSAIVKAYMECVRYAISQSVTGDGAEDSQNVQNYLIQDELMPLIGQSITDDGSHLATTSLFLQTSKLLTHLCKQLDKTPSVSDALKMFWTSLDGICTEEVSLAEGRERPSRSLEKMAVLLAQLQFPEKSLRVKRMQKRSVSFSEDGSPVLLEAAAKSSVVSTRHPELILLVRKLVKESNRLARSSSLSHLKFMVRLLDSFQLVEVFEELLSGNGKEKDNLQISEEGIEETGEQVMGESRTATDEKSNPEEEENLETGEEGDFVNTELQSPDIIDEKDSSKIVWRCFDEVLLPWVQSEEARHHDEDEVLISTEEVLPHVVNIVAAAFGCCDDEERESILDAFCQRTSQPQTLYLLIRKILDSSHSACVRAWLKSAVFGQKLLALTDTLCSQALGGITEGSVSQSWDLINLGLSVEVEEEPTVDSGYAEQILGKFTDTLLRSKVEVEGNEQRVHGCISFICDVATNFFSAVKGCLLISSAEDLLLALFQLGCKEATNFPDSVQQKILSAWTKGAESLIRQTGGFLKEDGFLCKAAAWINASLKQGPHDIHSIELLAKPAVTLMDLIASSLPPCLDPDAPSTEESFLTLLMPSETEWERNLDMPNQWMLSSFFEETLTFTELPDMTPLDPVTVPTGLVYSVFAATLLRPLEMTSSPEVEDKPLLEAEEVAEQNREEFEGCVAMAQLPWRYDVIAPVLKRMLYALQWCKGTMGIDAVTNQIPRQTFSTEMPSYCPEVAMVINATLEGIWKGLSHDDWKRLVYETLEMSLIAGNLWSSSLFYLLSCYARYQGKRRELDLLEMAQGSDRFAVLTLPSIHTLEALLPYLGRDQTIELLEINTAKLVSSEGEMVTHIDGGLGSMSIVAAIVKQDSFDAASQGDIVASCIQQLVKWREEYPDRFLFGCDFRETVVFDDVFINIKMMQLVRLAVERLPTALSDSTWDFILCSIVAWIQTCSQSIDHALPSTLLTAFLCATFDLLTSAVTLLGSPAGHSSLPANLCTEWREFFSDKVFTLMLPLFVTIVEVTDFDSLTVARHHLLQSASDAICQMPPEQLKKHTLPPKSALSEGPGKVPGSPQASSDSAATQNAIHILLERLCPVLLKTDRSVKLASFQLLEKVMDEVAKADEERLKDEASSDKDQREEESSLPPPESLKEILDSASAYMEVIFADVQVGECLTLDPTSAGYHQSLSSVLTYLLVWRLYLRIFKAASAEVRAEYANYLRQIDGVSSLMMNIFRLMPDPPMLSSTKGSTSRNMFSIAPTMKAKGISPTQEEIQHQACTLYYSILEDLPAMVRQWWTSQDKKVAPIVDK
ncbi:E3 ubiquitin-protein ligase listerin-like [Patiria miniata]|uniref:E3 ubiquitin-protein ligase listerin n=1 Tax=Patiria miniata TaxID=46514 RepID=A0A914A5P6_PATMI|nr:E3 ubiquitin-protein ligase listerin-like [Patiria miniata]